VTCLGATGLKPAGRTIPGGPRGLTCWPGGAALGLAPGRLIERGAPGPEALAFSHSSEQTVSALSSPLTIY